MTTLVSTSAIPPAGMHTTVIFWLLVMITLGSAVAVVSLKNIVHSGFCLVLTFMGVAGLYMMLEADFLAVVQIPVYAGAISILLVFAIMLTRRPQADMRDSNPFGRHKIVAGVVALLFFAVTSALLITMHWRSVIGAQLPESTVGPIAEALTGKYVLPMEIAAVLLLVATVGSIILARGVKRSDRS